jgi:predicted DNA-binding transcriptional regulator AlpA
MKKKATITVETERLLIISRARVAVRCWCQKCQTNVQMIAIDEAAAIAGLSQRTVFHLAEAGEIHFMETKEGQTLFCSSSLTAPRPTTIRQALPGGPSQQTEKD